MGNLKTLNVFEKLLAAVTLATLICLIPNYNWYFGSDSHFILNKFFNGSPRSLALDFLTYFPALSTFMFAALLTANIATLFGHQNLILRIVKAIGLYWIHQRLWVIGDGGMNLLVLSHLFLCLKDIPYIKVETRDSINDSLLWLLKGQFLLIYITAFFSKMSGAEWIQGEALGIVVQIDKFQSPLLHSLFQQAPIIEKIGTISVVILQGLLPLGLCLSKGRLKDIVIGLGISMHLGIAVHMGLVGFSAIMIVHYVLFFNCSSLELFTQKHSKKLAPSILATLVILNFLSLNLVQPKKQQTEILNLRKGTYTSSGQIIPYASISKLFALSLVDRLEQDGQIDVDAQFQTPAGKFKIRDLATFQAGIQDLETNATSISEFTWDKWSRYFKIQQGFRGYSNFSYALIQYILESQLGTAFDKLLEENLHISALNVQKISNSRLPFNQKTLAAFGLQGPISSLKFLTKNLGKKGFCLKNKSLCISGINTPQGLYFLGDQGENQLYIALTKNGPTAMNTYNQPFAAVF